MNRWAPVATRLLLSLLLPSGAAAGSAGEPLVLEMTDGRVMLNIRNESPQHRRLIAYSADGATKWTEPEYHAELFEPICMASLIRLTARPAHQKSRILFVNPDSRPKGLEEKEGSGWKGRYPRRNLTVRLSYDEGRTWPIAKVLEPGLAGYSDLAVAPPRHDLLLLRARRSGRPRYAHELPLRRAVQHRVADRRKRPVGRQGPAVKGLPKLSDSPPVK